MRTLSRTGLLVVLIVVLSAGGLARAQTLEISGRHSVPIDRTTELQIEGRTVDPLDLLLLPGMKVSVIESLSNRGAVPVQTLVFDFDLRGIVTGIDPVRVFGTPLALHAETTLLGWTDANEIAVGDALVVSGQFDINGSLSAGLIERLPESTTSWRLAGYVAETLPDASVRIGDQWLATAGIAPVDCPTAPAAGDFVILRADPIPGFVAGQTIDTVTRVACAQPAPPGTPGAAGGLEGVVDEWLADDRFLMEGLTILHDELTVFANGLVDDLEPGALIELEGTFLDAVTVQADVVEFVRPIVRIEGPAEPGDVVPDVSIELLGLTILPDPQTRDDDGIVAAGLAQATQIQVRGWIDRDGGLHATRVRERGTPDPLDLTLRGPIGEIAAPAFQIVGHAVDSSQSSFADEFGMPMTAGEFFALAADGDLVEIGAARYDGDGVTLIGGVVTYMEPLPPPRSVTRGVGRVLFGTVTQGVFPERIFDAGFE